MVPFHRSAVLAIALVLLFGSCDRVAAPHQSDLPNLDLTFGAWSDSAEAAADSLNVDHPFLGSITVNDTLWVRVKATGDAEAIRSVEAKVSGEWRKLSIPVFFPVSWSDSGTQRVKVGVYTENNGFYDSVDVRVTDRSPTMTLPDLGGNGTLRIIPDSTTSLFIAVEDDGRIDSLRWDLDGNGSFDTATVPGDTLNLRWSIAMILRARTHPAIRVSVRDDDGHELLDSVPLTLVVPPPSLAISGPDTVSVGDSLHFSATATGGAPFEPVLWPNGDRGDTWSIVAPSRDTVLRIRAIVRDSMGFSDTADHEVVVLLDAPRIVDQDTLRVHAGRSVHLSAGAIQRFGSIASWSWDLDGDGTFGAADSLAGRDTIFENPGIHAVGLRATDDDGGTGTGTIVVEVTDSVPALASSIPSTTALGDTISLSAGASDPDGDSLAFRWIVDGDTTTGALRKVAFLSVGAHVVTIDATSSTPAGTVLATVSSTDTILVIADPPRLDLGNDSTLAWGGTWKPMGATASDSTGTIVSTEWDFDGNGTWDTTLAGWSVPVHRFLGDTGLVVVKARVQDDDGNVATDSLSLRLDPTPWDVVLSAPAVSERRTDFVVSLSWTDSMPTGTIVRWATNEGLDSLRTPSGRTDSVLVKAILVDSLRITATMTSPSGVVTSRSATIPLDSLTPAPRITVFGPDTVSWNDTIELSAEIAGDILSKDLLWWNATTGLLARAIAPAHDTVLLISVSGVDNFGRADTASKSIVVVRDAPTAQAGLDSTVHVGRSIHLSGSATQRFGSIVSWGWDLDGDGVFRTSTISAGIDTTWETIGDRTVVLRVQDDDGNVDLDTLLVSVTDSVPSLSVSVPPMSALGDTVGLTATATDPDGDSLVVRWVVDGDTSSGTTRKTAFATVGSHPVLAIATSFTAAGTILSTVTIGDSVVVVADPPKLSLGNDSTIAWGSTWQAIGASASDSTGTIVSTEWDFDGNGTWDTTLTGWATPLHRFLGDTGSVVVKARVQDDDGNLTSDSLTLRFDPKPWNVVLTAPASATRATDILVHLAWIDSMPTGSTVRWTTNEGIDSLRSPAGRSDSILVRATLIDTLRVSATLTSPSGVITTRSAVVLLDSLVDGPQIFVYGPDTVSWNDTIVLASETVSNSSLGDPVWWDLSTGSSATTIAPAKDTVLELSVRVTDILGRSDTAIKTVVVVRDAPTADAGIDATVHAGQSIHLSGSATQRFGSIVSWGWDLDGDGIFQSSASSAGIDTTWETTGPRKAILRVQDDDGNVDFDTVAISVTDAATTLALTVPPTTAIADTIVLSATATDLDGDSIVVHWIVDGDTTTGSIRKVAFPAFGTYAVSAVASSYTPAGTFLSTISRGDSVVVVADPPKLSLGNDSTIAWGATWKAIGATASDSTGTIVATAWDFDGNGTWDTTLTGWATPLHRFLGDTGRVVVKARVQDDDGNLTIDSLALRLNPTPWNVLLNTPGTGTRGSNLLVRLNWIDSMPGGSTVRWTTNEGLDSSRFPNGRADSLLVRATLVDTLHVTVSLTSPTGVVTTRSASILLDALVAGPTVSILGPDSVSWNDAISLSATTGGSVTSSDVVWWNLTTGPTASSTAPGKDTTLTFTAHATDYLGRADTATKTVVVVRDIPVADAGIDETVHVGRSIHLSGSATQKFGSIVSWGWDLDGDGIFQTSATIAGIDTTWETVGVRPAVIRVQDDDGNVDLDTLLVSVTDSVPDLSVTAPSTVGIGDSVDLQATASDFDGDALVIRWIVDGDTAVGSNRRVAFSTPGTHTLEATATTYTPAATEIAVVGKSSSVDVLSSISVQLLAPDSVWTDTASGTLLETSVTAPGGLANVEWSLDGGANWQAGSLAGTLDWTPSDTGLATVIVRVVDAFGTTDSDTAKIVVKTDHPIVTLDDSIRIPAETRGASVPLTTSVRFGTIASLHWSWTDLDGARSVDQFPTGGSSISSPLSGVRFPPGKFLLKVAVVDDRGDSTYDSIEVGSVGIRISVTAPDIVAVGSNVHVTGSLISWPSDSALDLNIALDDASRADSVLDTPMLSAGTKTALFQASFAGSSNWISATGNVEGVDDPPQIDTFDPQQIAVDQPQDLSFHASRTYGKIVEYVWDLSAATSVELVPMGTATNSNPTEGVLSGVVFAAGRREVRYGVVTDANDTVWTSRYFDVIGPPVAVDDTLGVATRNGIDVGCEVGTDCRIDAYLMVDNDQMGAGQTGTPTLVGGLDGTTLGSNSDGNWLILPAPQGSGFRDFRYIISNGFLEDTGNVRITIYENTPIAKLDAVSWPLPTASIYTETNSSWAPQYGNWFLNFPVPDGAEFVKFYAIYPKITGAALSTGNTPNAAGNDSIAPQGADLLAIDPYLGYIFHFGVSDWMTKEEEVQDFVFNIETHRTDGLGIPGTNATTEIVMPVNFRRYVNANVAPTSRMKDFSATYDCSGFAKFSYEVDVAPVKNPHKGDGVTVTVFDGTFANGGAGYGDGAITGTFTLLDGKTVIDAGVKKDKYGNFVAYLPETGGVLTLNFDLKGFFDANGKPVGQITQKWLPAGYNSNASWDRPETGGEFLINNACVQ